MESLTTMYKRYFDESLFSPKNEVSLMPPPEVGTGSIDRITTYSGIEIVYYDICYHVSCPVVFASKGRMVELQFALSGQRQVMVSGQIHELPVGKGALAFMQNFKARFYPPAPERYVSLALGIPVTLFDYAANQLATSLNRKFEFNRVLDGQASRAYYFDIDSRSMALVKQLISDLRNANRSPLMMEASALELLNRHMIQLFDLIPRPKGLSTGDLQKLHRVKQVLETCMVDPPSLQALAKMAGLNDFKLKSGFKACFGLTVFEYLRHIRLDHAMKLLRDGEANVTEAAMRVGYSNVSAFSEQFFRRYGVKPSAIKNQL